MIRLAILNPRTITGQITGLVVLSVLIAYVLSIAGVYFLFSSSRGMMPGGPPPMQFMTIAQLAMAAESTADIDTILRSAKRIGVSATWLHGDQIPTVHRAEESKSGPADSFFERLKSAPEMKSLRDNLYFGSNGSAILRLSDGTALSFPLPRNRGAPIPGFIMGPLFFTLTIIGVCLLGISLYAARFITSPLSSFAAAAYSVGRTSHAEEPISERGPLEIVRVARALNDMRARIRSLLDERTNMLTAISHDLRTPLTRMKLRTERLVTSPSGLAAEGMFADIARMEQMLSETLTYLRDDTRTEATLLVDLPSVLETICTELADLGKVVTYEGPNRLPYRCKPSAITRAINNLVDNALKYGTHVSVGLQPLPDGNIQIDVADDGPGISYTFRNRVFEPFFKADMARGPNGNEGFGLGLSIARNVVEDHGGKIDLLTCVPHGLRVRIVLPSLVTASAIGAKAG